MLDHDALIVARHHHNLLHNSIKYGLDLCILSEGDIESVVRRKLKILIYRVIVLSEMIDHRTVRRPWQLALVLGELRIEFRVHDRLILAFAGRLHGSSDYSFYFTIQSINLFLLGRQLLLIFLLVTIELPDHLVHLGFILLQFFKFLHSICLYLLRILLHFRKLDLFLFQLFLDLSDLLSLGLHLAGQILEISEPSESLTEIVAGKHIHIPDTGISVLVGTADKTGIMGRKGINSGLNPVYLPLCQVYIIIETSDFLVTLIDEGLSVGHLLADQRKVGKHGTALGSIFRKLLVYNRYFSFKTGLSLFLRRSILR